MLENMEIRGEELENVIEKVHEIYEDILFKNVCNFIKQNPSIVYEILTVYGEI